MVDGNNVEKVLQYQKESQLLLLPIVAEMSFRHISCSSFVSNASWQLFGYLSFSLGLSICFGICPFTILLDLNGNVRTDAKQ